MNNTINIITISREFGSGGRSIGETIAHRLGYAFYDRSIIEQVAERTGLSEKYIAERGEYAPDKSIFSYSFIGRTSQGSSVEDYIYRVQRDIIRDIASSEKCVIVGRCADYILKDRDDVLNVFIHGNNSDKCERIMKLYDKSEKDALALMKATDKKRSINYSYYTDRTWGDAGNYALCLNSSILGYDNCINIIAGLAQPQSSR